MTTMPAVATDKNRTNPVDRARQAQTQQRVSNATAQPISHDRIARRAYEIWERKGRPEGQCEQNWAEAEAELRRS